MDKKYWIDTDVGDDIDDMFALLLAANANLPLVGISTVFRNSVRRAKMTEYLLGFTVQKDIPVYAGVDAPFLQDVANIFPPEMLAKEIKDGEYFLPQWNEEIDGMKVKQKHAVDALIESANAGGLTLIAIGPFTNVAMAMRKAPQAMKKLEKIILIGGIYDERKPEWNIACDPEAAQIVFSFGVPVYAMGAEVVRNCPLTDQMQGKFPSMGKLGRIIGKFIDQWNEHYGVRPPILYDTLAIAGELGVKTAYAPMYVRVGLMSDKEDRYLTLVSKEPQNGYYPVNVCQVFDFNAWQELIEKVVLK